MSQWVVGGLSIRDPWFVRSSHFAANVHVVVRLGHSGGTRFVLLVFVIVKPLSLFQLPQGPLVGICFMLPLSLILFWRKTAPEIAALLLMYGASASMRLPRALFMTVQVYCVHALARVVLHEMHSNSSHRQKSPNHESSLFFACQPQTTSHPC